MTKRLSSSLLRLIGMQAAPTYFIKQVSGGPRDRKLEDKSRGGGRYVGRCTDKRSTR